MGTRSTRSPRSRSPTTSATCGGTQSLSEEIIPPDTSDQTWIIYVYDLNGNLTTRKDNQGNEGFDYDALNRMFKQTPQSPSAVVEY